jgi:hypothetical protein
MIMSEKPCVGEHRVHICQLAAEQKHEEIKKVAAYPKYMCMNCGRVAEFENNLCNPSSLDDIRPSGT